MGKLKTKSRISLDHPSFCTCKGTPYALIVLEIVSSKKCINYLRKFFAQDWHQIIDRAEEEDMERIYRKQR